METIQMQNSVVPAGIRILSTSELQPKESFADAINFSEGYPENAKPIFIGSNTEAVSIEQLKRDYIIPVFKDNQEVISHQSFISTVYEAVRDYYQGETTNRPDIRVSHIVKGRVPSAAGKRVEKLRPKDITMYYERSIFAIQIPSIHDEINGNRLNLSVVGCKAYNTDNLSGKLTEQKFSVAVGFNNQVCQNQCIFTDGVKGTILAKETGTVYRQVLELLNNFNIIRHFNELKSLLNINLTEHQFCQILGKMKLYNCLDQKRKREIPKIDITDTQINNVSQQYVLDKNFKGNPMGITLWDFYNLMTGSNKKNYIDNFIPRAASSTEIALGLAKSIMGTDSKYDWFLQ